MNTSESKTLFGMEESITFCEICLQGSLQLVAIAVQLGIWFENTSLRALPSHHWYISKHFHDNKP